MQLKIIFIIFTLSFVGVSSHSQKVLCKIPINDGEILGGVPFPEEVQSIDFLLSTDTSTNFSRDSVVTTIQMEKGVAHIYRISNDSLYFNYEGGDYLLEGSLIIPPRYNYYYNSSFDPITYVQKIKYFPFFEVLPAGIWKLKNIDGEFEYKLDEIIFLDERNSWPLEYEKQH